ncbi:MAG TPA: ATP-binding protein [Candidatus Angelobacter sp.]|jgi:anti-sigma regulatory factor (Ser/Thr protein kinase)|nr:ATP-binding protein [Candidatus Angelobacter sp.]
MEALTQAPHLMLAVVHPEDVGAVRRRVSRMAADSGVEGALVPKLELVVTELATNLVRHAAGGGSVLARVDGNGGVEVLSVDGGPGIRDVSLALSGDGAGGGADGGLGCGLAAVRRLADDFDVYTAWGRGTVVLARFSPDVEAAPLRRWGGVSVALDGGEECGDGWAIAESDGRTTALVVDGLGHGSGAAPAARAATTAFLDDADGDLEALAHRIHAAMRATRGGAAALCRLDPRRRSAEFVGVGNVAGRLLGGEGSQMMLSHNGTLGTELAPPRIRRMSYALDGAGALVMSSDGVRDGFELSAHPGLLEHDPLVVAAAIHSACSRGTDDATVVVVRPMAEDAA